jgi:uncharacterized protein (DUF362 family)
MKQIVAVAKSGYNDVYVNLDRSIKLLDGLKIPSNGTIVIKINICDARSPETGAITHPLFLDAVLRYLRENFENLRICVVESDATVVLADNFIQWFGYRPIIEKWNGEFVNLSKIKSISRKISGRYFKEILIPEIFEEADFFITLPKVKTNSLPRMTCCLKNQFGCLPSIEKGVYHHRLDDVIVDLNMAMHPDLCLVDGIIAMGGTWGPAFGVPIPLNAIICSQDPVAADTFCAKIMGFNPRSIGHIRKSASSGIGSMRYILKGDTIDHVDFEINKIESWLVHTVGGFMQKRTRKKFRIARG